MKIMKQYCSMTALRDDVPSSQLLIIVEKPYLLDDAAVSELCRASLLAPAR